MLTLTWERWDLFHLILEQIIYHLAAILRFGWVVLTMAVGTMDWRMRSMMLCLENTLWLWSKEEETAASIMPALDTLDSWWNLKKLTGREVSDTFITTNTILMVFSSHTANYDSVYVVGALDEALNIRGFRYHPADIEASVVRCHKNVIGRSVLHLIARSQYQHTPLLHS